MENSAKTPFYVKNCSLASIATGLRAGSLEALRNQIASIDEACLFYHFWGSRLNLQFTSDRYHNDFASWVFYQLHDSVLAEKLSIIDPTEFPNLESLRQDVLETIDSRLDQYDLVLWTKKEEQFRFIRSLLIVFETQIIIQKPTDLPLVLGMLAPSSIFYHFIDARARTEEKTNDFSLWFKDYGNQYDDLIEAFRSIDLYFLSLTQIKEKLVEITKKYFEV